MTSYSHHPCFSTSANGKILLVRNALDIFIGWFSNVDQSFPTGSNREPLAKTARLIQISPEVSHHSCDRKKKE